MIQCMHGIAMIVIATNTTSSDENAFEANFIASSCPSCSNFLPNIGTKAALNAPSPKIRRKRLGKRNAEKNASPNRPDPKYFAIRISRKNPSTRLMAVKPDTFIRERSIIVRVKIYLTLARRNLSIIATPNPVSETGSAIISSTPLSSN